RIAHGDGEVAQATGQRAGVRRVHDHGRSERAGVGLRLGHASPRLDVGVEREGDGGQNADDGHDDHQLDEREAALVTHPLVPEAQHVRFLLVRVSVFWTASAASICIWPVKIAGSVPDTTNPTRASDGSQKQWKSWEMRL